MQLDAELCGWTVACVHAKSGGAATISGYAGQFEAFDEAISKFAMAFTNHNERDHAAPVATERKGPIDARVEEDL